MTLKEQMVADCGILLQNTSEHAVSRNVKNARGVVTAVAIIISGRMTDVETYELGTKTVHRARVGIPSSYAVTVDWEFDVDGDGVYWAVDRNIGGIQNNSAGWLWVPVTYATIHEAASAEYRRR